MSVEYQVCIYVEDPPQYLKLYKTLRDYDRCNVSKIVVVGNWDNPEDKDQYNRLKEIYEDITVEFIDRVSEMEKAEELLETCKRAKHLIILKAGWLR